MALVGTCFAGIPGDQSKVLGLEQLWAEALWTLLPLWVAVLVGLVLGWSWRPKWVAFVVVALRSKPRLVWSIPPGFGARRLWLAATAAAAAPSIRSFLEAVKAWAARVQQRWVVMSEHLRALRTQEVAACFPAGRLTQRAQRMLLKETPRREAAPSHSSATLVPGMHLEPVPVRLTVRLSTVGMDSVSAQEAALLSGFASANHVHSARPVPVRHTTEPSATSSSSSTPSDGLQRSLAIVSPSSESLESPREGCSPGVACEHTEVVGDEDLSRLMDKLDDEDGSKTGQPWEVLMEKKSNSMTYTAWRRDPQNGPTEYRSRTVVEDCATETMRDFFWDDDFRPEWDGMLAEWSTLEACSGTGVQVVRWVRKFPLFCKNREYIIGRRIWSHGNTYYCVTKALPHHPDVVKKESPRRVDQFFSSWRIQPLDNGSCEVMLFHQEDMGLQRDVAKMGIRQGMWNAVRKIEPGVRSFRKSRDQIKDAGMLRSLSMAKLNTPLVFTDESSSSATTPREGGSSLAEHKRVRRWVSSNDLTRMEGAGGAVSVVEGVGQSGNKKASEDISPRLSPREASGALPSGTTPSPRRLSMVGEEVERISPAEMGAGAAVDESSASVHDASRAPTKPDDILREVARGAEVVVRKSREVGEERRGRGRGMPLAVAATAVALVCHLEAGWLVKVAVAGALKHALGGRRR